MTQTADEGSAESRPARGAVSPGRIESIDILRGLVMAVMALDHVREYFHAAPSGLDPTDPAHSYPLLFLTRWITYFCAPTFVFLSGTSAWLRGQSAQSGAELPAFLATRGIWLIFLELTLIGSAFTFHPGYLFLQVIWAIGAGFLVLSLLCLLPTRLVLLLGVLIVGGHNLIGYVHDFRPGGQAQAIDFIDGTFSFVRLGPLRGVLLYSALGWVGLLLLGYGLGPLFAMRQERRSRLLVLIGAAMIAGFFVLRFVNGYGDPNPWEVQPTLVRTAMSFMRVSKYPPSLDFVLATIGPMLILLALLERVRGPVAAVFLTFGRVPFFYYVLHISLIHGSAAFAGMLQNIPFKSFTDPLNPPAGFGVPLGGVYFVWVTVVAALYFPCSWFERLRRRRSDWWLSYV